MTMISDPDMPAIELGPATELSEQEAAARKPSRKGTIGVVVIGAALVTLVNLTAAVYLYRGINDLRAVEARLEELGQFEQRIGGRLDTVNNGFQSRFEKLDSQLQSSFSEINGSIARLQQSQPAAGGDSMTDATQPSAVATSSMAQAPAVLESADATEPSVVEAPRPPKRRVAAAAPPPNSNYQRIEQADGKVYYRKIK